MLLYIHIPFCTSKCGYCGFNSLTNTFFLKDKYLDSLQIDLQKSLENITELDSIYIGGGTPNTLKARDYEMIFSVLESYIKPHTEVNIELNPNSLESLLDFKHLGINRFSIGVQSFYDDKLALLERIHDTKTAIKFIEAALKCDVNVSIDLIYDTTLDTKHRLNNELNIANSLGIGHISCYALSIDTSSRFWKTGKNPVAKNSLCYDVKEKLDALGYHQYEVSNYAKTHKSKHNLGYWKYDEYIGIGLSAVGRIGTYRIYKDSNLATYINNPISYKIESLSDEDMRMERILLGLRSEVGVDCNLINNQHKLQTLLESNKCHYANNKIYAQNYFLADELALWLV